MLNDVLRQGFQLANRRPRLILLDLAWKSIWLVLTLAGLFLVAILFSAELRSLVWAGTSNRAVNGAIAVALLRRFWQAKHAAIFAAVSTVLFLSLVAWFLLEASVRARIMWAGSPPQLRRGAHIKPVSKARPLPEGEGDSAAFGSWNFLFRIFLVSNILKYFFIGTASLVFAAICFGRYLATPFSEWPQLWADTRGGAFVGVVAIAALGFLFTILDTLVRNDAIELLGTDLFRVTGLITILLSFETMMVASFAVMLGTGLLQVAGLKSAVAMPVVTAAAVGLLNVLHSYLLLVRYLAVGILRQNVVEI